MASVQHYCLWPGISVTQSVTPVTCVTQAAKSRDIVTDASSPSGDHPVSSGHHHYVHDVLDSDWILMSSQDHSESFRWKNRMRNDSKRCNNTNMIHFIPPAISVCWLVTRALLCPTNLLSHIWSPGHRETPSMSRDPRIYKSIYYTIQMECNNRGRNNYQQGGGQSEEWKQNGFFLFFYSIIYVLF